MNWRGKVWDFRDGKRLLVAQVSGYDCTSTMHETLNYVAQYKQDGDIEFEVRCHAKRQTNRAPVAQEERGDGQV